MAVITISRQYGAGGKTLAKMLAKKLGYTFVDADIIKMIAKEANVSPEWVESVEKDAGTRFSKIITSMIAKHLVDQVLKDEKGYIDDEKYLDYLVLIITKIADENNAVILGRGSQYILNNHPDAFHLFLIRELENRVKFIIENYKLTDQQARQVVNDEDKRRLNYFSRLGKKDFDNPSLYHMVLNMNRMDINKAFQLICTLLKD